MSKRIFTTKQLRELRKNPYVKKCSEKSVTYAEEFKILAVKRYYEEGLIPSQIFNEAGFDRDMLGKNVPNDCLHCWKRLYKLKGVNGLSKEQRGRGGGRPRTKGVSDADRIERLETEIAYLKVENDFLAKLRAKRRE